MQEVMEGRVIPLQVRPLPLPLRASLPGRSPLHMLGCPPSRSIALVLASPFTWGCQLMPGVGSDIVCAERNRGFNAFKSDLLRLGPLSVLVSYLSPYNLWLAVGIDRLASSMLPPACV